MARRVFVDTANNSKPHVCYDPDEGTFFEVADLRELLGKYDEVYIDSSMFPNMWPQIGALIDNGVGVFYFAWPWKWKRWREKYADLLMKKFGKEKTDYGDAYILSRIHDYKRKAFKEVTSLDVEFKPLLVIEKTLADILPGLQQRQVLGVDFGDVIENLERELRRVREEIVKRAMKRIPRFTEIVEKLGLNNDDVNALSALAGLLIYLKWPYKVTSMHKAIRYLGLYKPTRENMRKFEERSGEKYMKRYSGHARRYLSLLTAAIMVKEKNTFPPKARDEKGVLRMLLRILKTYSEGTMGGGAG